MRRARAYNNKYTGSQLALAPVYRNNEFTDSRMWRERKVPKVSDARARSAECIDTRIMPG